jgi:hypothetical protein
MDGEGWQIIVLFTGEILQTISMLLGVIISGIKDNIGPFHNVPDGRALETACRVIAGVDYYFDPFMYLWQCSIAWATWAWIVRRRSLGFINTILLWIIPMIVVASGLVLAVAIWEKNLGLWPHSNCFITRAWARHADGSLRPSLAIMVDKVGTIELQCCPSPLVEHNKVTWCCLQELCCMYYLNPSSVYGQGLSSDGQGFSSRYPSFCMAHAPHVLVSDERALVWQMVLLPLTSIFIVLLNTHTVVTLRLKQRRHPSLKLSTRRLEVR